MAVLSSRCPVTNKFTGMFSDYLLQKGTNYRIFISISKPRLYFRNFHASTGAFADSVHVERLQSMSIHFKQANLFTSDSIYARKFLCGCHGNRLLLDYS